MTSLREQFESSVLNGYRTVSGGYSFEHTSLRFMRQSTETSKIPLHFLSRFALSELADATAANATPVSDLSFNERKPNDNWTSTTGTIAMRELPGMPEEVKFICSAANTINDFVSTIERPFFAYPDEPEDYEVDLNSYGPSDLLYMTISEIDSGIDLSQSWVMLSDVPNAPLGNSSWKMASLDEATITGSQLTLALSNFSSVPSPVAAVRLSLRRTTSSGAAPAMYVSELGVRDASAVWRPMSVNTLANTLRRSGSSFDGDSVGPRPLSQPQMIWANSDNSRVLTLGGITTAEFDSGSLPSADTGSVRFLGGDSVVTPTFNANITHEMTNAFSISCWVRLNADSFDADRPMGIVSKYVEPWDDATETYGVPYGSYRLGVDADGLVVFQLASTTHTATHDPLQADTWYHIAIVRDGTSLKFFINGELVDQETVSAAVDTNNSAPFAMATWSTE